MVTLKTLLGPMYPAADKKTIAMLPFFLFYGPGTYLNIRQIVASGQSVQQHEHVPCCTDTGSEQTMSTLGGRARPVFATGLYLTDKRDLRRLFWRSVASTIPLRNGIPKLKQRGQHYGRNGNRGGVTRASDPKPL